MFLQKPLHTGLCEGTGSTTKRQIMITGGNLGFEAGVTLNLHCVISRVVCVCVRESLVLCGCVRWQQQLQQYCKILEKCRTHCISSRGLYCFIWTHIRSALTAYFCVSLSHFKGSIKWLLDWQVPQWFECFIRETAWCWVTSGVVWILNKSIADILVLVYII